MRMYWPAISASSMPTLADFTRYPRQLARLLASPPAELDPARVAAWVAREVEGLDPMSAQVMRVERLLQLNANDKEQAS